MKMTIEEIIVGKDPFGIFEHDKKLFSKLTENYTFSNYDTNRNELANDYICLLLNSEVNLKDLYSDKEIYNYLKEMKSIFSQNFIEDVLLLLKGEFYLGQKSLTDLDEILFLERLKSLLGIHNSLDYDVKSELLKIMEIAVENLEFDIPNLYEEIEL